MRILLVIGAGACTGALVSCGTYRGLPGHGGGMRFDEEQRIVAASIRRAVADMKLAELPHVRIQLLVSGVAHYGAGNDQFPGATSFNLGVNDRHDHSTTTNENAAATVADGAFTAASRSIADTGSYGPNASLGFRFEHAYSAAQYMPQTEADVLYLEQIVRLRMLQLGLTPCDHDPELRLRVLVDVLGTNRSEDDWVLYTRDELEASCELTWYVTAPDDTLRRAAQRTGATATYSQTGGLLLSGLHRDRSLARHVSPELELEPLPLAKN